MSMSRQIASRQDAEHLAAEWMREHGFADARVTQRGADGGVDVLSSKALAQVKYQTNYVGRPLLQRLLGARGVAQDKHLLFFTGSSYTATARNYADTTSIALFTYELDGTVHPVNGAAERLVANARPQRLWRGLRKVLGQGSSSTRDEHPTTAESVISVMVSGGIAGIRKSGAVRIEGDSRREEVERLIARIDFKELPHAPTFPSQIDGLVYVFSVHGANYVVADWQLTQDLARLASLVLED